MFITSHEESENAKHWQVKREGREEQEDERLPHGAPLQRESTKCANDETLVSPPFLGSQINFSIIVKSLHTSKDSVCSF
jgi:hypothetical protein